jgi:thioredoxin reductase
MLDVVVIGGGPGGLQAALTLARGQRTVAVLDAGTPRNARAHAVHNFVSRDGTPPAELRAAGRAELARYGVEVLPRWVTAIAGGPDAFVVHTDAGEIAARRVIVATGMVDVLPDLPGFERLWGDTVFTCPFCHGHEVRQRRWAVHVALPGMLEPALLARSWTSDLVALSDGTPVDDAWRARLGAVGVRLDTRKITGLVGDDHLAAITFAEGPDLPRDVLMIRPPQRQTALVTALGLPLDANGFVAVDASGQARPGIYVAGDLGTMMQSAVGAAAAGQMAAARLIHGLLG